MLRRRHALLQDLVPPIPVAREMRRGVEPRTGRIIEGCDRLAPDARITDPHRSIGADILEKEGQHIEAVLLNAIELAPSQLVLIGRPLSARSIPRASMHALPGGSPIGLGAGLIRSHAFLRI
jgi:hypothetical protein